MDGATHSRSEIAGAGADESQALVPCELGVVLLHESLDLLKTTAEPGKGSLEVSTVLHGNDAALILLIDPDQKRLLLVVPITRNKIQVFFKY